MNVHIHKLWSWLPMGGITLGHHIFLKNPDDPVILGHELVHVAQQDRDGSFLFYLRYIFALPLFWNPYRREYEAEAYAIQVRAGYSVESMAKILSGSLYGWCCRSEKAAESILKYV